MIYVVGWLFCGLVTAIIGSRKGEGCAGFFFGILLGPFGILFAIYSRGNREECPFCKELIHNEAVTCPHCQKSLHRTEVIKKTGFTLTKKTLGILGILVIFMILIGLSQSTKNNSESNFTEENAETNDTLVSENGTNKEKELTAVFNKSLVKFQENLKDPEKVKVIECLGVKVYNDPQPPGHPPSPEECARIKSEIEETASPKQEENHLSESDLTVATDQELQAIKPFIYAAETLNKTCSSALNGSIEKVQVCSQRDSAVQRLKNYGWCWKQDAEIESEKHWVKCNTEQKSSQGQNSVELQNNSVPAPQVVSLDDKKEKSTLEVLTNSDTELSKNQDSQHHFYVQIGVFSDEDNVKQLQGKLSDLGYKSQTEIIDTNKGKKIRLRTQEFSDRNEAGIALNDIKDAGLSGMVVSQ